MANGIGVVANTTAPGGEAGARRRPSCALPARLTAAGQHQLAAARATVIAIEQRMTDALPTQRAARVLADLGRMAQALEPRSAPRVTAPDLAGQGNPGIAGEARALPY